MHNIHMPLLVFDCEGIPATGRECIEAAVEAGGKHVAESYEGWIAADPFRGGARVVITGPQGSSGRCGSLWTNPTVSTQRVRETLDE